MIPKTKQHVSAMKKDLIIGLDVLLTQEGLSSNGMPETLELDKTIAAL